MWRVDSRRVSTLRTRPDSSADLGLLRGPGPRTTVAGAVGRMAMRWGRMKAIVQDRYGSADVLDFRDVARPEAGPGDVLVKVVAAGVDLGAWHFMTGQPYLMRILGLGLRAPRTRVPRTNVAGRGEAVGRDVAGFEPGEQVYGTCRGAYAEYARVRQDKLAPIPTGLSFEQAAVTPYACFAALQALRDHGKVQPDQQVLVVGASGAVGTFAVQLAKAFGAEVTGVCSGPKAGLVRSLGADHVIDYTGQGFAGGDRKFDLVIDIGGGNPVSPVAAHPHTAGQARHRRRRGRPVDRGAPPALGEPDVVVRAAEAGHVHRQGERRGPAVPERAHGGGEGQARDRPHLPARRRTGRGALLRVGPGDRADRPCGVSRHAEPVVTAGAVRLILAPGLVEHRAVS